MKKTIHFLTELFHRFQDDEVPALGAQLTYYLILSFFPFLIFVLTLVSYTPLTRDDILSDLALVLPTDAYILIRDIIDETVASSSQVLLSFGMIATIWAASKGVMAIIKGINKAYDEAEDRPYWKVRLIAIVFMFVLVLVMLLSLVMMIFGKAIGQYVFELILLPNYFETIWGMIKYIVPISAMILFFIFLYYTAPNRKMTIKEVIPGAIFTTLGWIITSLLFAYYVNNFGNYSRTYGSIGGIIALLLWLYISSIIIILGGEINAALAYLKSGKSRNHTKNFGSEWLPFLKPKRKE